MRRGFIVILSALLSFPPFAGSASPTKVAEKAEPEAKITVKPEDFFAPIKEEVKVLRAERRKKMPYLDRGYLRETVSPKAVQAKQSFIEKREKALDDVIVRALSVYTPAQVAKERISLAKRRIMVAARGLLPEASFNFELRKGSLSRDAFSGQDYHFIFRQPVFRGGILWNTLLREKADLRAAKKEYEGVLNELVDGVAKAYFEFNRTRETYKDKQELLQRVEKQHKISQEKYRQALISEIEHLNVESMVGQLQYDLETAEQELELAKLELQRFLDLDIEDEIEIAPLYNADELIKKLGGTEPRGAEGDKGPQLKQSLEEFVDLAYQHRPELAVEAEQLRSARLGEAISRGPFFPRLDLLMEFGELGEAFLSDADDPTHFPEWRFGVELSNNVYGNKIKYTFDNDENAPSVAQFLQGSGSQVTRRKLEVGIFDGLKDFSELKEAQVKKLEQVVELEKKEREVIREVKEAYFDYRKAEVKVESSLKRNQYRERLLKVAELRLGKAEIEVSDYLQAQIDVAEERGRLHQALADLSKAKSKLNRAIGIRDFLPMEERYGL
jgi:outer membrane protein TolC